jgi:predicted secreted protein
VNVTPVGSAPPILNVGAGVPVAVTVNVPAAPTENVVLFALVICPGWFTVRVKLCVATGAIPFWAVIVIG